MEALEDSVLHGLLRTDREGKVVQKEETNIEYKLIFDRNNKEAKAKYVKELAALYNTEGGYLIFGIEDKTNGLEGLKNFVEPDSAMIADDINNYFKPSFQFKSRVFEINNKSLFVIYVSKRIDIPAVCIKNYTDVLRESTIYYRYSTQSAPIHAEDLIYLLVNLKTLKTDKLSELKEREMTIEYRPKIIWTTSGYTNEAQNIVLQNKGRRVKVNKISSLSPHLLPRFDIQVPFYMEENQTKALLIYTETKTKFPLSNYEINLHVENEIDQSYTIKIINKDLKLNIESEQV